MRKFLRILLLTAILAGALCVSALAAEPTEGGVYDVEKTAENIVYIDRQAADADGTVAFTAYPQAQGKGSYRIFLLGGDQILSSGSAASFQAYVPYTLGDVNDEGRINSGDALMALQCSVHLIDKF